MAEGSTPAACMAHLIHPNWKCKDRPVSAMPGNELQIRLCEYHMWQVGRHSKRIQKSMDRLAAKQRQPVRRRHVRINHERELRGIIEQRDKTIARLRATIDELRDNPTGRKPTPTEGTVYFLRSGGYIKIGWTSDLQRRMRAYPPDSELLASRPGTRKDEAALHKKFAHLRSHGREWFPLAPQIRDHIKTVTHEHGQPPEVQFAARETATPMPHRINKTGPTPKHWSGRAS